MIIRSATAEDAPSLIALLRRSWLVTMAPEVPFVAVQNFAREDPATAYVQEMWQEMVVAGDGSAVAGMLHVVDDVVAAIHVDPRLRGCGIGGALMDFGEREIFARHAEARLEVLSFNTSAQAFYRKRGYLEAGRHEADEYGAAVIMIDMVKARPADALRTSPPAPSQLPATRQIAHRPSKE
ncbi:MAG TPA: N-acetyltransferase [Alphaproteobacteria bacterium]|nr:N-acetyltransferase [Alphaproteobacteria bacterium]